MKYITLFLTSIFFISCNKPIDLVLPSTTGDTNFNFYSYAKPNPTLYFRPFKNIPNNTPLTVGVSSSEYIELITTKDTLLSGDEVIVSYSDFNNFRLPVILKIDKKDNSQKVSVTFSLKFENSTKQTTLQL